MRFQAVDSPAPWAGINTRDGVPSLKPNEARDLINWRPAGTSLIKRDGYTSHSTGMTGPTETLQVHRDSTGTSLIAVDGGSIYDVSGATASSLASGYTDSRFQTETYNGWTFGVNGTDTPWRYDGSTVQATGWTGPTLTNLNNIALSRSRLWLTEKNSSDVWYGPIGGVTGTLTKFQLSQIAHSGDCVAIGSHSRDAGEGMDDFTVFVMEHGEIIVYSGDPGSTFTLIGVYHIPKPVGKQCLVSIGGQLAILSHGGLIPLQAAMTGIAFDALAMNNFGKIAPSISDDVDTYETIDAWSMVMHDGYVHINVPTLDGFTSKQWIYNTQNPAWGRYEDIPAASWAVWDGELYFGAWEDGIVYKMSGTADNSASITCVSRGAFGRIGARMRTSAVRFDVESDGASTIRYGIDTDYQELPIEIDSIALTTSGNSTAWGSPWGSPWGSSQTQRNSDWFSTCTGQGNGQAVALAAEMSSASSLTWFQSQVMVRGGGLK